MAQKRPMRAFLLLQIEALKQRAVSGIAAEGFEPRLDLEIDHRRLAFRARVLEQSEGRVAIAETSVREREMVGGHINALRLRFELRDDGTGLVSIARKRLGMREPRERNGIVVAAACAAVSSTTASSGLPAASNVAPSRRLAGMYPASISRRTGYGRSRG